MEVSFIGRTRFLGYISDPGQMGTLSSCSHGDLQVTLRKRDRGGHGPGAQKYSVKGIVLLLTLALGNHSRYRFALR